MFRLLLKSRLPLAALTILVCCPALPAATPQATLTDDPAHPAHTSNWLETRLFFGLGPAGARHAGVTEAAWQQFLDTEVTPRFPTGLSVVDVYGQWLGNRERAQRHPTPTRIRSKMLLIDYPGTPENAASIDAIRAAWKKRTGDLSVLKVTQPVDVSF